MGWGNTSVSPESDDIFLALRYLLKATWNRSTHVLSMPRFSCKTETVKQHDSFVRQLEHFGGIFLLAASQLEMSDDPGEPGAGQGLLHIPGLLRAWL